MEIRFASIPKCASRSLEALGLLGESPGKAHSPITDYPDWVKYDWHLVMRPEKEWLDSWWTHCKKEKNPFAYWLGMTFENQERDLACFQSIPATPMVPCTEINRWVPNDFSTSFPASGLSFYAYCVRTITAGIVCTSIKISDLDSWLIAYGYAPCHLNERDHG